LFNINFEINDFFGFLGSFKARERVKRKFIGRIIEDPRPNSRRLLSFNKKLRVFG
jgi:hypothetical protein